MKKDLTRLEAFNAMTNFLDLYYHATNSDNIAVLLSGMQIHPDGKTWDPAAWEDWMESVDEVLKDKNMEKELTMIEALQAMIKFLWIYYKNTSYPDDVGLLIDDLHLKSDGSTVNPGYWPKWNQCVQEALEESLAEAKALEN